MSYAESLERDLQWREEELASLNLIAARCKGQEVAHRGMLRALWALLYAHYEGFSKFCWDTYLDELQRRFIISRDLSDALRILSLESIFRNLRGDLSSTSIMSHHEVEIPGALSRSAAFPEKCRPSTDSNLWPSVFEAALAKLGLECQEIGRLQLRIRALVSRRNDIAHGKKMTIETIEEYRKYEEAASSVMHELALQVIESIENRKYTKVGAV